ncbi:GNAT family N-acetyltransferase [Thermoactinospora rubra]|uniref:GNAT family N-acetyltransferase n=1 Tax=Thermoactinospora rubra TaxID=1088767 RepID=UPI000A120D34|nr:GNAT family N-acetyltransferase [Thermoactinospora rubra]
MDEAVQRLRAQGFTEVVLWVASGNAQGRRFYERYGFAFTGRTMTHHDLEVEESLYRLSLT